MFNRFFSACLIVVLACGSLWADENWPQYRGPNSDGTSSAKGVPTKWSETENVIWKTAIHDKGWASPVVWGNQVWLTTAKEDGKAFYAVCVDRETGKIVHDIELFTEDDPAFCHPFNSYASPTPAIEEGRIYVHFGSHGTACLDTATGKVLWLRRDLECDHFRGPGSSPLLSGDKLYLIFDGVDYQYVAALDKNTGKTVWRTDRNIKYANSNVDYHKAYATPALIEVEGKQQLVCPSAEETIAYDPETGEELWRFRHGGMNASSKVVSGHGLIYLTSGHNGRLFAMKAGSKGVVPTTDAAWSLTRAVPSRPSLMLLGELLFFVDDKGVASCVDAKTGEEYWQERLSGEFSASPVYADGKIYFCSQDGRIHVVAASKEFDLLAVNRLDEGFMASPAIAGSDLFLRTKTHLYRIGKK